MILERFLYEVASRSPGTAEFRVGCLLPHLTPCPKPACGETRHKKCGLYGAARVLPRRHHVQAASTGTTDGCKLSYYSVSGSLLLPASANI